MGAMKLTDLSVAGLAVALLYVAAAIWIVRDERVRTGGGWISLNGMASFLATLPVSAPCEWLGCKLDHRRNLDMAFAIGACAALVYGLVAGAVALGRLLLART